ncbi:MAG: DUF3606 domain-containing protein [Tahibacter sp.]
MGSRYAPEHASNDTINLAASWEINYWATRWGVSQDELIHAVAEVGTNLRIVQAYLGRGGPAGGASTSSIQRITPESTYDRRDRRR